MIDSTPEIEFAASTITNALRGRRVMSRLDSPTQRWAERVYHSLLYRAFYIIAASGSLLLALWEPPVQAGGANRYDGSLAAVRAVDAAILFFVAFDLFYLQTILLDNENDVCEAGSNVSVSLKKLGIPRRGWLRLKLFTLLALSFNLICVVIGDLTGRHVAYPMRMLRPVLLVERLRNIRALVGNIITTAPSVFNILLILLMQMTFSGALAFSFYAGVNNSGQCTPFRGSGQRASCSTFDGDTTACRDYFSDLSESLTHLFELSTTSNFPGLIVPAYNCNKWNALFFVSHIVVSVYLLVPLFTAVSYASFFDQMKAEAQLRTSRMFSGVDAAFKTLSCKSSIIPEALVITKQSWIQLFAVLRPTMPLSVVSKLFDVFDETAIREIDALEFRRALCNFGPVNVDLEGKMRASHDAYNIESKENGNDEDEDDKSVDDLFDALDEHVSFKEKLNNDLIMMSNEEKEKDLTFSPTKFGREEGNSLLLFPSGRMAAYGTNSAEILTVITKKEDEDSQLLGRWGSFPLTLSSQSSSQNNENHANSKDSSFLTNIENGLREYSLPTSDSFLQPQQNIALLSPLKRKFHRRRRSRKCCRACRPFRGTFCGLLEFNHKTMHRLRLYRRMIRPFLEQLWVTIILDMAVVVNAAAALSILVIETDDIVSSNPPPIVLDLQTVETSAFFISLVGTLLKLFSYSPCVYWHLGWVQKADLLLLMVLILSYTITTCARNFGDTVTAGNLSIVSIESNELTSVVMLLRFVRITRVLQRLNGWGQTVGSIIDILPVLGRFLFAVLLAFFSIAIIGMELFAGLLTAKNEAVRTSSYGKAEPPLYDILNFDSLHGAFLCLFTVVVQGDWPMLMEAAVAATGKQARWYFVFCWACINAILLATAIGFIVESFQAYRQKRKRMSENGIKGSDGFSGIEDWRALLIESSFRGRNPVDWKGVRFIRSRGTADVYTEIYREEIFQNFKETFTTRR
jgi:hypothetical protein